MRRLLLLTATATAFGLSIAYVWAAPGAPERTEVRGAIQRAIPLIEKGSAGYLKGVQCFSCHHQAMATLALTVARDHGFRVDSANLTAQSRRAFDDLHSAEAAYREGRGQGGGVIRAGYALFTLDTAGGAPNDTTAAVAAYLLKDRGTAHWGSASNRPPSESSPFTATYLALRGLSAFTPEGEMDRWRARRDAARGWLLQAEAKDHEDRVFRLLALTQAGVESSAIQGATRMLLDGQARDGGWSQLPDLATDAYATGTALFALRRAGVPVDSDAYRRGAGFLLKSQLADGSWRVTSRSKPFQPYFESGFPHGKDQWISMAATCWAVAALADAAESPGE